MTTRVGVVGASGNMGRVVCRAVHAADDLDLVAGVSRSLGGQPIGTALGLDLDGRFEERLDSLVEHRVDVAVDFTSPAVVDEHVRWYAEHGIHAVVGTTGLAPETLEELHATFEREDAPNAIVAPNFALGAVLMMRFAAEAARHFPAAEVIELHHDGKVDAPSGTALATVREIARARPEPWRGPTGQSVAGARGGDLDGVRIHSVRLPGLLAHQQVIFGAAGETLTIRHDSTDRVSFMPGVLLAIRAVASRRGLTVGLEPLLGLPPVG